METSIRTAMNYADTRGARDAAHGLGKDGQLSKSDLLVIAKHFGNKDGKTLTVAKLEEAGFCRADANAILTRSGKTAFKEVGLTFGQGKAVTLSTNYAAPGGTNDTAHARAKDGLLSSDDLRMIAGNFGNKDGKTLSVTKLMQAGFTKADAQAIMAKRLDNKDFRDIVLSQPQPKVEPKPPAPFEGGHVREGEVAQIGLKGDYAYVFSSDSRAESVVDDKQIDLAEFKQIARLKGDGKLSADDLKAAGFTEKDAHAIYNRVGASVNEAIANEKGHAEFHAVGVTFETNVAEDVAIGARITADLATNLVDSILHAGSAEELHHALKKFESEARAMMGDNFGTGLITGLTDKIGHIVGSAAQAPIKSLALMSAMVVAQAIPGLNVVVNAALVAVGGMHVVHDISELIGSIQKGDGYKAGKDAAGLVVSAGLTAVGLKSLTHSLKATSTFVKGTVKTTSENVYNVNYTTQTKTRSLQLTDKRGLELQTSKQTTSYIPHLDSKYATSSFSLKGSTGASGGHGHATSVTGVIKHTVKDVKELSHFFESSGAIGGP